VVLATAFKHIDEIIKVPLIVLIYIFILPFLTVIHQAKGFIRYGVGWKFIGGKCTNEMAIIIVVTEKVWNSLILLSVDTHIISQLPLSQLKPEEGVPTHYNGIPTDVQAEEAFVLYSLPNIKEPIVRDNDDDAQSGNKKRLKTSPIHCMINLKHTPLLHLSTVSRINTTPY
jgi:hypothetical protein